MSAPLAPVGSLVELAPAAVLGAAPVLAFLAPWVVELGLSVSGSECSEFGLAVFGEGESVRACAAAVSARFGAAVLVDAVEDVLG